MTIGEPTIALVELSELARKAFGDEFVRLDVKTFKRRYEKITVYVLSKKPGVIKSSRADWSHMMTFTNENKPHDPDKVRLWVREFLQGIIDNQQKKSAEAQT